MGPIGPGGDGFGSSRRPRTKHHAALVSTGCCGSRPSRRRRKPPSSGVGPACAGRGGRHTGVGTACRGAYSKPTRRACRSWECHHQAGSLGDLCELCRCAERQTLTAVPCCRQAIGQWPAISAYIYHKPRLTRNSSFTTLVLLICAPEGGAVCCPHHYPCCGASADSLGLRPAAYGLRAFGPRICQAKQAGLRHRLGDARRAR